MADYSGTHIETHHAWQILHGWIRQNKAIGVIFWGQSANVYTIGVV